MSSNRGVSRREFMERLGAGGTSSSFRLGCWRGKFNVNNI